MQEAGGTIHKGPQDIPGVGRFAVAGDPHGAGFMLFQPNDDGQSAPVSLAAPGHIGWHELYAGDLESAFGFYSGLFGWKKADVIETPVGPYQLFATGGAPIGGMMTKPPHVQKAGWLFYFIVDAIDAAVARVGAAGGEVLHGPMPVPGDSWIVQARDPQGAIFVLTAPRR